MNRKLVLALALTLLVGMLSVASNVQKAEASGTIYIRADGSIEPPAAPISTVDNATYTLTGNITSDADGIVVERSNIVIDGAGYTVQGTGSGYGIYLSGRSDVTIESMEINTFSYGIWLFSSDYNSISGNNITANNENGILLSYGSNYNSISGNNITNNSHGIGVDFADYNRFYHNNFIDNMQQIYDYELNYCPSFNAWDDGYPSGGNYWSDYGGVDLYSGPSQDLPGSDGIGDTPYVIASHNQDNYPLMNPWFSGWILDFAGPTNHPIVDFAVYNGSLYAATDNKLYVKEGSSWSTIDAPTFVASLEPYGGKLVAGGKGGLYCYDGTSFSLVFSVPTYIKVLGAYNNTLYAGTMLDSPPKLYYCNGSADNPSDWHIDTGFSDILNFTGPFGSIDSFAVFNSSIGNPVGFWRFDENSGTTAYDSSGNANDGVVNGAAWTPGISGSALDFNGLSNVVRVENSPSLQFSDSVTVSAWVKVAGSTGRYQVICAKWYGDGGDTTHLSFVLEIRPPDETTPDGRTPWFRVRTSSSDQAAISNTPIAYGEWVHIAGTYDGTTVRIYINGTLTGSTLLSGPINVGNQPVMVGAHAWNGDGNWFNGTIDEVRVYNYSRTAEKIWNDYVGNMYVTSGGTIYCFNGIAWSAVKTYDDVMAFSDTQVHNSKLCVATRDQGWRKPMYQGGTGFSGRVIEYDGENWTTVLDHDYWVYSLEVYDDKLYAGTANKILTYNGTDWETSFNATEGAYYAIAMINYEGKIYAGMGNGYIFADPAPIKANPETVVIPEFSSTAILAVFMAFTMLAVALTRKNRTRRFD